MSDYFDKTPKGFFWYKATKGRNIHLVSNNEVNYQNNLYEDKYPTSACGFTPKDYPGWHFASTYNIKYCLKCKVISADRALKEPWDLESDNGRKP